MVANITVEEVRDLPVDQYQILRAAGFELTRLGIRLTRGEAAAGEEVPILDGIRQEVKLPATIRELDPLAMRGLLLQIAQREVLEGY